MHRLFPASLTCVVCLGGLGLSRPASAQELTPVQQSFVRPRPLTMMPDIPAPENAPAFDLLINLLPQAPSPGQGAVPTPKSTLPTVPAPQEFKPGSLGRTILYAMQLTFYEHVMRVAAQSFTREQLKGPFIEDWYRSVHWATTWNDGDSWQTNYLGHAIHGSAAVRIWLDQRERKPTSKAQYFKSLSRAYLFALFVSEQYEIGPLSEASIGNVGMYPPDRGWIDQVWTPIGGVAWAMAEDGIDKYFLTWVDQHVPFLMARAAARMVLNPGRMLSNVAQNHTPWYRERPISIGLGPAIVPAIVR